MNLKSIKASFAVLSELYLAGGIEICSPAKPGTGTSIDDASSLLLKTIIQPDGDVSMYVSEDALNPDESEKNLLISHFSILSKKINSLKDFRLFINKAIWGARFFGAFLLFAGFLNIAAPWMNWNLPFVPDLGKGQALGAVASIGLSAVFFFIKSIAGYAFQMFVKRKIASAV